jgi:hypothetical protein
MPSKATDHKSYRVLKLGQQACYILPSMLASNLLPTNPTITEAATALHLHSGNTAENKYNIQTQSYPETKDNGPAAGSGAVEGHS